MKVLSIDPSVNHVGWAIFDTHGDEISGNKINTLRHALKGGLKKNKLAELALDAKRCAWSWGTFELEGSSLMMRTIDLLQQIKAVHGFTFDYLITEKPAFFDNQRGHIAARQNYTIDLAFINGYIAGWMHMDHRMHHSITAITWKGSVTKEVTAKHFFRCFPGRTKGISEHSIDATMLLHYWLQTWAAVSPLVARHTSSELILGLL